MIDQSREMRVDSHESISKTMGAVDVAKNHPFKFGFRDILKNGGVKYSLENGKWMMTALIPSVVDEIWSGNCVQDALLTSEYLSQNVDESAKIIIQRMESKKMGNTATSSNHFRVLVEQNSQSGFIMETIDHSPFHNKYFSPLTDDVKSWVDLTDKEIADLKEDGLMKIHTEANGVAYCEFTYDDNPGIAYTYMNIEKQSDFFSIGFDLYRPELDSEESLHRVKFPIYFGEIKKNTLKSKIENTEFFSDENNKSPIPFSLRSQMKDWFIELIDTLPHIVEKPKK